MLKHTGTRLGGFGPQTRTSDARAALRNDLTANHTLTTKMNNDGKNGEVRWMTHATSAGHAALAGTETSFACPFGCFSVEDVGAAVEAPAAVGLHLAAWNHNGCLLQSQDAIGHDTCKHRTLFLSASSRGPQQESTLTRLALAGIFGLP
jgi:hypothetical protein